MRTTIVLDDDVYATARGLAERDRQTLGQVVSELARKGLNKNEQPSVSRSGIRLMPVGPNAGRATLELVNRLRDEFE